MNGFQKPYSLFPANIGRYLYVTTEYTLKCLPNLDAKSKEDHRHLIRSLHMKKVKGSRPSSAAIMRKMLHLQYTNTLRG